MRPKAQEVRAEELQEESAEMAFLPTHCPGDCWEIPSWAAETRGGLLAGLGLGDAGAGR